MYASFEFYRDTYRGVLSDTEFYSVQDKATQLIDRAIRRQAGNAEAMALMADKLTRCECDLIDQLFQFAKEDRKQSTNKASENNAGNTVSYRSAKELEDMRAYRTSEILSNRLTYPFNLMYGGG